MATKKSDNVIHDLPTPPLPKFLLPKEDKEHEEVAPLKPEDIRASIQLAAIRSLELLDWHARNIADPKMSILACQDLMDRAGYVKAKVETVTTVASGPMGVALPAVEDDVRSMSDAFNDLPRGGTEQ